MGGELTLRDTLCGWVVLSTTGGFDVVDGVVEAVTASVEWIAVLW